MCWYTYILYFSILHLSNVQSFFSTKVVSINVLNYKVSVLNKKECAKYTSFYDLFHALDL